MWYTTSTPRAAVSSAAASDRSPRHVTTPVAHGDVVVVSSHQVGMVLLKISRAGKGFKAEQAWLSKDGAINFASPVAVGEHLYGLGPSAIRCLDGALWPQRSPTPGE